MLMRKTLPLSALVLITVLRIRQETRHKLGSFLYRFDSFFGQEGGGLFMASGLLFHLPRPAFLSAAAAASL